MLDPFRLCLALGPVMIYLLLLTGINLLRRPVLVPGTRDTGALGLAVSGMVLVGPMQLFVPVSTLIDFRSLAWVLLVGLYALVLLLILLLMRPRLVIYNISLAELRPVLSELAAEMDPETRWAGDSVAMPNVGVQFSMEATSGMRNVSLVALGARVNLTGWRRLEHGLQASLANLEVQRNPHAASLLGTAILLGLLLTFNIARDPQTIADSLYRVMEATQEIGHRIVTVFSYLDRPPS